MYKRAVCAIFKQTTNQVRKKISMATDRSVNTYWLTIHFHPTMLLVILVFLTLMLRSLLSVIATLIVTRAGLWWR